jgi:2-polyprenyl-6-methoxyphenol hydroxylase-like FAD-dependent oxidoreductase
MSPRHTKPDYDVVIVGSRCAGAATALLLARKGYRVLLTDRAAFPSDTMSTHLVKLAGVVRLARWGLLDAVTATGCPPITRIAYDFGGFGFTGTPPPLDGQAALYAPRRIILDEILVNAAVDAGAELRERYLVEDVIRDAAGKVVGIRGGAANKTAPVENVTARLVIGADGLRSVIAQQVDAPLYDTHPSLTCTYYAYWSGLEHRNALEIYPGEAQVAILLPTNDGRCCIMVVRPASAFPVFRTDVEGNFWRVLNRIPALAARVRAGRREERFVGTGAVPGYFRKPYGPGWALVGDAGHHRDPAAASGISDAFRDAELLSEALDAGFAGTVALDAALAGYERLRNAGSAAMYDWARKIAAFEPLTPEESALMSALVKSHADADRYAGAYAGSVPVAEFFAPENIARIAAGSCA